jgi:hypothetical protein
MKSLKVMCLHSSGGPSFVRSGWGRAFVSAGHRFAFWSPQAKSAFDAFSEFEPDVFLGTTYDLDEAVHKCVRSRPHLKVGLFASAWGDRVAGLDRAQYPIVYVSDDERQRVERMKKETGRPDFVFVHCVNENVEGLLGGWREIGVRPMGVLNGYDAHIYGAGTARPELACDAVFVGNRWPYKARNLDRFLLPLCQPAAGVKLKIFGSGGWDVSQFLGSLPLGMEAHAFLSATVCPNVSEPHSTDLGFDIVERIFKAGGAGGFVVSDPVQEARALFPETALVMSSSAEYAGVVRHYARHPAEREPYVARLKALVRRSHSYHHRVVKLLHGFGLFQEAAGLLDKYAVLFGEPVSGADYVAALSKGEAE